MSSFETKLICLKANEAFLDPSTGLLFHTCSDVFSG